MYEHLNGRLVSAGPAQAVVECGGVGYLLRIPLSTFDKLPAAGSECLVLTHLHCREDAMELFGFATEAERRMFKRLVSVSGVGPSTAIALMSRHTVGDIIGAVRRADAGLLQRAKGIGRKTAERIALELKGAVAELEALLARDGGEADGAAAAAMGLEGTAAQALVTLGYSEDAAARAVHEAAKELGDGAQLGEVVREALKRVR